MSLYSAKMAAEYIQGSMTGYDVGRRVEITLVSGPGTRRAAG